MRASDNVEALLGSPSDADIQVACALVRPSATSTADKVVRMVVGTIDKATDMLADKAADRFVVP